VLQLVKQELSIFFEQFSWGPFIFFFFYFSSSGFFQMQLLSVARRAQSSVPLIFELALWQTNIAPMGLVGINQWSS
jgi:hypothetical protein